MKRCSGTTLLVFVVAVGAYAVADNLPQPQVPVTNASVQTDSASSSKRDNGDIPPPSGASADKPRVDIRHKSAESHASHHGEPRTPPHSFKSTSFP